MNDATLIAAISDLVYVNPFLEERIEQERRILGDAYVDSQPYWSLEPDLVRKSNIDLISAKCAAVHSTEATSLSNSVSVICPRTRVSRATKSARRSRRRSSGMCPRPRSQR